MAAGIPPTEACPPAQPNMTWGIPGGPHTSLSWGSSSTCNITNANLSAQASANTEISLNNSADLDNSITLKSTCDGSQGENCGNYVLYGNDFSQTNNMDLQATQLAYASTQAQQQLMAQAAQAATSTTKGLVLLPETSSATNIMNANFSTSMSINTDISTICQGNEQNNINIDTSGYTNVVIADNNFTQTNEATQDCTQDAVANSVMSQSISASLSQIASATTAGLNFWVFLLIFVVMLIGCMCFLGFLAYEANAIGRNAGIVLGFLFLIGFAICLILYFTLPKETATMTCGPSIGVQNASNNPFTLDQSTAGSHYNTSTDALNVLTSNDAYFAMDWIPTDPSVPNSVAGSGKANYYTGTYYSLEPVNGQMQCPEITDQSNQHSVVDLTFRNPAYVNGKDDVSGKNGPGDVYLNIGTGELYYKLPPISGTWPDVQLAQGDPVYQTPDVLHKTNKNNVFDGAADSLSLNSNSVYFWIPPSITSTNLPDMTSLVVNDNGTYTFGDPDTPHTVVAPYPPVDCCGSGNVGIIGATGPGSVDKSTSSPAGWYNDSNGNPVSYNSKVTKDDFFVVAFPQGPTITPPATDDANPASSYETYEYSQRYLLFPVVLLSDGNYYPAISDAQPTDPGFGILSNSTDLQTIQGSKYSWSNPANTIVGMNVIISDKIYESSAFKYQIQGTAVTLQLSYIFLALSIVSFIGAYAAQKLGTTKKSTQQLIPRTAQTQSLSSQLAQQLGQQSK